jgi:septal ring factor EnvC (AmiA/AmiB activator)
MTTPGEVAATLAELDSVASTVNALWRELDETRDALADSEERRVAAETERDLLQDQIADLRNELRRVA